MFKLDVFILLSIRDNAKSVYIKHPPTVHTDTPDCPIPIISSKQVFRNMDSIKQSHVQNWFIFRTVHSLLLYAIILPQLLLYAIILPQLLLYAIILPQLLLYAIILPQLLLYAIILPQLLLYAIILPQNEYFVNDLTVSFNFI